LTHCVKMTHPKKGAWHLCVAFGLRNDPELITLWNSYSIKRKASGLPEISKEEFIANSWAEYRNNPSGEDLSKQLSSIIIRKYRLRYGQK
jgi:hypothetical protein